MFSRSAKPVFPLGLVLFALGLNLYKAFQLTVSIGADWRTFAALVGLDLFFMSLLVSLAMVHGLLRKKLPQVGIWLFLLILIAVYMVDSFVLLALDDHAALFDIGRYTPEIGVVLSFFDFRAYGAVLLFLLSILMVCVYTTGVRKISIVLLLLCVCWNAVSISQTPQSLHRYSFVNPVDWLGSMAQQGPVSSYSKDQLDFYAGLKQEAVMVPAAKPDIILLVIESLSSINSTRVSGQGDLLQRFDQLTSEGLLFTNFFANHQASEGGMISLLSGFPPIHFPTATPYMFDEFAIQPAVISEYRQQGYFTEFLTNSDLSFIGLNRYLEGIGVDRSRGRDEVDAMRVAQRIVQDAPADDFLYDEAISTLEKRAADAPAILLVLATTSTHLPATHPAGGPDTQEAVWDWSLLQLTRFYQRLDEMDYFDHGVLLVTGDHRHMRPVTQAEIQRYGDAARARVPLLLIGKDWPRGATDQRFFQQSDLLRKLGLANDRQAELSPRIIWVERYNRKYGRVEQIDRLSVFDQSDDGMNEFPLRILGSRIDWLRERPSFSRSIENRIHAQRSLHQLNRNGSQKSCAPEWSDRSVSASDLPGLNLGVFDQSSLDGVMEFQSPPATERSVVDSVTSATYGTSGTGNSLLFTGFLNVPEDGVYRFRVGEGQTACMSFDQQVVLDQKAIAAVRHEISVELVAGQHFLDLRFSGKPDTLNPLLEWVTPGREKWRWKPVPGKRFHLTEADHSRAGN
jgi:phosphoglycerol transferase MdoB-like AlkP superfamily enzyme